MPSVLIVDDLEPLRGLIRFSLEREGFQVYEASTGREALERYRTEAVDVVLLDLSMPEWDGPTTLQRFKHEFPQTRARFILLSGDPGRAEPEYSPHLNGANGFHRTIAKPFELQTFVEVVRQEYATKATEDGHGICRQASSSILESFETPLSN
ncbi:MAG: response regulator [Nitrospiraceae bacterium]